MDVDDDEGTRGPKALDDNTVRILLQWYIDGYPTELSHEQVQALGTVWRTKTIVKFQKGLLVGDKLQKKILKISVALDD